MSETLEVLSISIAYLGVAFSISWVYYDPEGTDGPLVPIAFGMCWPLFAPILAVAGPFLLWSWILKKKGGK